MGHRGHSAAPTAFTMVPPKASSASSLCSAAPLASSARRNHTQDATPLARSSVPPLGRSRGPQPTSALLPQQSLRFRPAPEGAGAPHLHHLGGQAGEGPEKGDALATPQ